jgi:Bacteriophage tail sheath protein
MREMGGVANVEYTGVYVEELAWGARSIGGVPTSTAAFVGRAVGGPTEPVCVRAFAEYERAFGPPDPERELGHAVSAFFENGGSRAWVVRVDEAEPLSHGVNELEGVRDLGLLCLPGETDLAILRRALHVAERRGLFLVGDAMDLDPRAATKIAGAVASDEGARSGALYWPPLRVTAADGSERLVAPSGAVCGLFARVDISRGVWKPPAGTEAALLGTKGPAAQVDEAEVSSLADARVNAIRAFPGRGIRVWGGRTLSSDREWKYVNVRRLFVFLERSIDRGLQWTVFEPNDRSLWAKVRVAVGTFLADLWHRGAFQGRTPWDAFFVRCDRSTMTQDDLESGRLNVVIGFAPLKPAEFVVIEISKALAAAANDVVGESTGEPGLEVRLPHRGVDPMRFVVMVEQGEGWTTWSAVEDLTGSGPDDAYFMVVVDEEGRAVVRFGDGEHGAIPPKDATILASYRYGGGEAGNRRPSGSSTG